MNLDKELFLVLNLGLKSIRVIVFDKTGKTLFQESLPVNTTIKGKKVEQDPNEWWNKSRKLFSKLSKNEEIIEKIKGVTVTGSASCLIPVNEKGEALSNAIMVSDKRSIEEANHIEETEEYKEIDKKLGLGISAYFMLPKILWLKNNKPNLYKKSFKFLSPNDYLLNKLCNEITTDVFNAQKYHFDHDDYEYPKELLNKLDIEVGKLPKVSQPGTYISTLKRKLSTEFGFCSNVKVVLSTYDAICAFLGSGPNDSGVACDVSGTVTSVRVYSEKKIENKLDNLFLAPLKKFNINIVGGSNNLGGGLIEWVKQAFYSDVDNPYELMEKEASESNIGANGLIFLPYLLGERAPIWDDDARGSFWGIERTHTRKDFVRAVFESAAFITNDILNEIESAGIRTRSLKVSGGLTRINLISQIKSDVIGKDVELVDNFETTALGGLVLLLMGTGHYADLKKAINNLVDVRIIFKSNKENHQNYRKIFNLYKDLYNNLKPLYKKRQKVMDSIYLEKTQKIENL